MGCRRTLFQPGLKIKKNFLLRWKSLRTNAKKVRESNYPDIDYVVSKWFLSQRGKSIPIDGTFKKEKASMQKNLVPLTLKLQMGG